MLTTNKGVIVDSYVPDLAGFTFDSMARIGSGQVPHNDFHSPIGQAFYWPFAAVSWLIPAQTRTVLYADALVAVIALIFLALLARSRLVMPLFSISLLLVLTTAVSPREIAAMPWVFDHLALYNRWSWAFLVVLALSIFLPRRTENSDLAMQRRLEAVDGCAIGTLLFVLALLKITYFAGAGVLILLAVSLRSMSVRSLLFAVLIFVLLLTLVEISFHNLANYANDLKSSLDAGRYEPLDRRGKLIEHLKLGAPLGLAILMFFWILRRSNSPQRELAFWWKEIFIAAAIMIVGALVATQNFARIECPLFAAALIVVLELACRRTGEKSERDRYKSVKEFRRFTYICVAVLALIVPFVDTAAIVIHRVVTSSRQACRLRALQGTPAADLMFPPGAFSQYDRDYAVGCDGSDRLGLNLTNDSAVGLQISTQMIADGTNLLRPYFKAGQSSLPLTFGNPFPLIMHGRSPVGSSIWWDVGRTYSPTTFPNGERLFDNTDWVMEPVVAPTSLSGVRGDINASQMMKIYGDDIRRQFALVKQTASWRLWGKKHV